MTRRTPDVAGVTLDCTLGPHGARIGRFAWSPDGWLLAAPVDDGTVTVWDLQSRRPRTVLRGHEAATGVVAWSPNGRMLATASDDATIRLWHRGDWSQAEVLREHGTPVNTLDWAPDSRRLASGGDGRVVFVWDLEARQLTRLPLTPPPSVFQGVTAVAWRPDGGILATLEYLGGVRLWDPGTSCLVAHHRVSEALFATWSRSGKELYLCANPIFREPQIQVWRPTEAASGPAVTLEGHTEAVDCCSPSHDDTLLASKGEDGTVRLWRCDRWETVAVLDEPTVEGWPTGVAFHPQVAKLATLGDEDRSLRIWDVDVSALLA